MVEFNEFSVVNAPAKQTTDRASLLSSYADQGYKVGNPIYETDRDIIIDYIGQHGYAPNPQEIEQGRESVGFDYRTDPFTESSTMGKLGFGNLREAWNVWNTGGAYGAGEGALKPDPERDAALRVPFQPPTMEEALMKYSPEQVAMARIEDYKTTVDAEIGAAAEELQSRYDAQYDDIITQLNNGTITNDQAIQMRDELEVWFEAEQIPLKDRLIDMADIQRQFGQGVPASQLPYLQESMGVTGAAAQELYNQILPTYQAEYDRVQANIPPPDLGPQMFDEPPAQIEAYVGRLGLTPEYQDWVRRAAQDFFYDWQRSGRRGDWITAFNEYLKRGGR